MTRTRRSFLRVPRHSELDNLRVAVQVVQASPKPRKISARRLWLGASIGRDLTLRDSFWKRRPYGASFKAWPARCCEPSGMIATAGPPGRCSAGENLAMAVPVNVTSYVVAVAYRRRAVSLAHLHLHAGDDHVRR